MRLKNGQNIIFLSLGFILMTFVGCSNNTNNTNATVDLEPRLYMTSGETGSLEPTTNNNEYIITLHNVPSEVRWITDRHARKSGIDTTINFIENVWHEIFDVTAPNAILKFLWENEDDGLFLTLKEPAYDADRRTLSFTATLIRSTFEEGDPRLEETMEFEYPAIVILNNGAGFNFVVHSETATVEKSGQENIYTIIQNDIDNEVLWMSGAPSTLSTVTTAEELANNWETFFSAMPPNAFMFGITDNGELKGYPITLENMEYSHGDTRISYSASTPNDDPIENLTLNSVTLVIDSDLIALLSSKLFYGPSITKDILFAFSFTGIPPTEKGPQTYAEISEDALCSSAEVPLTDRDNIVRYSNIRRAQSMYIYGAELKDITEWAKITEREPDTATGGKLTISAYKQIKEGGMQQIFSFICDTAGALNFDVTTGNIKFWGTGGFSWAAKAKTITGDPAKIDYAGEWNNE